MTKAIASRSGRRECQKTARTDTSNFVGCLRPVKHVKQLCGHAPQHPTDSRLASRSDKSVQGTKRQDQSSWWRAFQQGCQDLHHGILLDVKDGAPLYVTERVDSRRERSFVRGGSPTQVNQGVKTDTFTYRPIESLQERVAGARRVRIMHLKMLRT